MRFSGIVLLVVAVVAFAIALKSAPREPDLTWHEGRVASVREMAEAPTDKTQSAILFGVAGLEEAFQHEEGKPGYDTLRAQLTKGAPIAVLYDPNEGRRFTRAWAVKKDGRMLLAYAEMEAWDKDNRRFGLILGIVLGIGGLILVVAGFRAARKDAGPASTET